MPGRTICFSLILFLALCCPSGLAAQQTPDRLSFLAPADTFHKGRFWTAATTGTLIYGGFAYGLYQSWYRDYELTRFHTFDDLREWQQMDKVGHLFTTHIEANLLYSGARWAGISPRASCWTAAGIALWLQTTIEIMDGFSAKWGFSWSDMAFNAGGAALFVGQEYLWKEQRILMKVSSDVSKRYPGTPLPASDGSQISSLDQRVTELFGSSFGESFLKDYNAMTIWASFNIRAFAGPDNKWPAWLNLAAGYGAENMFGGFENKWTDPESGLEISLARDAAPRYRQFYLSPDIDFSRIRTRSRVLKTLLRCINYVKIPAPALEIDSRGRVKGHWLMF